MKTKATVRKRFLVSVAITFMALIAIPVAMVCIPGDIDTGITNAWAAGGEGKGNQGKGYHGGRDGAATTGATSAEEGKGKKGSGSGQRGRSTLENVLSEEDDDGDDSDRPPWAGVPGREGKPGGGSSGGDTKKGVDYGDMYVILRDDNGVPILNDGGFVQPLDADGNLIPLDDEGHPIDESLTQEVELGRLNISRSPERVLDHALSEAISKLDGLFIKRDNIGDYTDEAGRLVDADGNTIDSPLENLALYEAIVDGLIDQDGNIEITVQASGEGGNVEYTLTIHPSVALDLAAAAFAASSDKTANLNVDAVSYISGFLDADISAVVEDYNYNREDTYENVQVWILVETSPGIFEPQQVNILDVVSFNDVPAIDDDGNGIDTFTQAADDALQVLEYVHDNALVQ